MRLGRTISVMTAIAVALLGSGTAALASVSPETTTATLLPGESMTVTKTVDVPEFPPKLDLVLDVDLSGSYGDDIDTIKTKKSDIFNGVRAEVADSRFGLTSFVDYPFAPWGFDSSGDFPYQRNQDLTADQTTWESAVDAMSIHFGGDGPESQLESLRQAATGAGQDLNGDGDFADLGEIAPGLNPSFRADATKVIALTTDAAMHTAGDSDCTSPSPPCPFPYPGPSFADTVAALNAANIKVVAIKAPGSTTQMDDLANATGGAITSTDASSSEIVEAIVGSLEELTFDITGNPVGCDPLDVSFDPAVHSDVAGGTTVQFEETIAVPEGTPGGDYTCTVEFRADDTVIGVQEVTITVPVEVPVDIKPASCPNPLSQHSRGVLPAAIVGTADFDATRVDPDTVTLEGVAPLRSAVEDVATPFEPFTGKQERDDCTSDGADGIRDLTLKFDTEEVRSAIGPVSRGEVHVLTLRGALDDGTEIIGEDVVWIR